MGGNETRWARPILLTSVLDKESSPLPAMGSHGLAGNGGSWRAQDGGSQPAPLTRPEAELGVWGEDPNPELAESGVGEGEGAWLLLPPDPPAPPLQHLPGAPD